MITNESQVRLTVSLRGRLASIGANSSNKKERKKMGYILRAGKKCHNEIQPATYQSASEGVTIGSETVQFWISPDGYVGTRCSANQWKKMKPMDRLQAQLQIQADYLSGMNGAKYSFEVIN